MEPGAQDRGSQESEIKIQEVLSVIWGGKYWILLCCVLTFVVGSVNYMLTPKVYRADAMLQLERRQDGVGLSAALQGLTNESLRSLTEIEILKSRSLLGRVVEELNLDWSAQPRYLPVIGEALTRYKLPDPGWDFLAPYGWHSEKIVLGELTLPRKWVGKTLVVVQQSDDMFLLRFPDGSERQGQVRVPIQDNEQGVSVRIDELVGQPGREFIVRKRAVAGVAAGLRGRLSVNEAPRHSSMLRLRVSAGNRREAEQVLDALAQAYVAQNVARSSAAAQRSIEFLETQMPQAEEAVKIAQDALNSYRQQQQSVDLNFETQTLLNRATEIEAGLNQLLLEEENLKQRFTINHPSYKALIKNRERLTAELQQLRAETGELPETQQEIFNLTRDLEVAQQVFQQLRQSEQELRVVRASSIGNVRIIDNARARNGPVSPNRNRILASALAAGLVLGIGFVLIVNFMRKGVRGGEDLEEIGLPVFATVPFSNKAVNHRSTRGGLPILAQEQPTDIVTEALRSLRTSLHFGMLDANTNTVMLTSPAPGAGKSFTAVNLAVVTAEAGQKVCLVDADLRRGYLRRYFGLEKHQPGLAAHLAGAASLEEVQYDGGIEGLTFIPTGPFPPNPSELLMRETFTSFLKTLNETFDLVILDSPPSLAVTDPIIMARNVGAAILIVRHMETAVGEVEAVRRSFETSGVRLAGAVLNGYRQTASSGQYQYYNYRYSYKTDSDGS